MNENEIAEKIIREMREDGLTFGEMLRVIRAVESKFKELMKVKR